MNKKEEKILNYVNERVEFCLRNNIDKDYIADSIDDIIFDLPEDSSSELFSTLYRIQETILMGGTILSD